jgi:HSP20 family protein
MPIIPWRPFWDMDRLFDDEDWPDVWERPGLRRFGRLKTPKIDIYETEKEVVAKVEIPGVDPKNIKLEVEDNVLKIEAKSEEKKEEKKKGYYRKEISSGFYKRAIPLPSEVIGNKANADYKEGILTISIPKTKSKKEKKKSIEIKVK